MRENIVICSTELSRRHSCPAITRSREAWHYLNQQTRMLRVAFAPLST
ncbi:MAG: hypothetical protein R6U96_07855 [Promethearchaeia archaeon]